MKMKSLIVAFVLTLSFAPATYAQTAAPSAPAAPTMKPGMDMKGAETKAKDLAKPADAADMTAKKAKAKECSMKADAQKLHGKARKEFREKCKES
ncbi:hypothetical protein [Methylocapsa palsarum]|uniref:PsiF repeat-containing protein n=1 Tax=Methylocapsa palsarum TaxID=1612308 RepID=A0A1I4ACD1_9HYPH|nr:hypothetical protein [Methylocapsa palsarum]SFK54082.1 hypothetical protein SAMN05444581_1105 [Methylocapsa palsarum]